MGFTSFMICDWMLPRVVGVLSAKYVLSLDATVGRCADACAFVQAWRAVARVLVVVPRRNRHESRPSRPE